MAIHIHNPQKSNVASDVGENPSDHMLLLNILLELKVMNEILQGQVTLGEPVDDIRADLMNTITYPITSP